MKLAKQVLQEVLNSNNTSIVVKGVSVNNEMDKYAVISVHSTRSAKVLVPIKGSEYRPIEIATKLNLAHTSRQPFGYSASIDFFLKGHFAESVKELSNSAIKVKKDHGWMTKEKFYLWLIKEGLIELIVFRSFPELQGIELTASKVKHGDMELIGFDENKHSEVIKHFDSAEKALNKAGFRKMLYGKMFLVPKARVSGKFTTFADYVEKDDSVRVFDSATKHKLSHPVRTIIHELGHRYYYKKISESSRTLIKNEYYKRMHELQGKNRIAVQDFSNSGQGFKIGDRIKHPKHGELEYEGIGGRSLNARKLHHKFRILKNGEKTNTYIPFENMLSAVKYFTLSKDSEKGEESTGEKWFPTKYSQQDHVEWFAEVFSFGVVDNDKEVIEWIKELK